ncbi:PHP domain-containing protein [Solidesulfovibrio alcoholivorans]|uniref:PHP domain-containing protein n=1 Tax=Solidesulfovibrio alcoholivorans TaxID=81406 RepID=UPI000495AF57|nr:PHP domain-containing protein [Solidesulfovibrio alcoholivorans]
MPPERATALFPRFSALTPADLAVEGHTHTDFTDGLAPPRAYADRAVSLGLSRLAFTEHIRRTSTYWPRFAHEAANLRRVGGPRIWVGFEAKVCDGEGTLDIPDAAYAAADVVLGSVHAVPGAQGSRPPRALPREELALAERDFGLALVRGGRAQVLAHAGGMSLALYGDFPLDYMDALARECAGADVAFEVNARYHAPVLTRLLPLLARYDPRVSLGSDAHEPSQVGAIGALLRPLLFPDAPNSPARAAT